MTKEGYKQILVSIDTYNFLKEKTREQKMKKKTANWKDLLMKLSE